MILETTPAVSLLKRENLIPLFSTASPIPNGPLFKIFPARTGPKNGGVVVCSTKGSSNSKPLTGVIFEPFEEVKKELMLVPAAPQQSLARQKYADECEAAINEQIKWVHQCFYFLFSGF